VEEGPDDGGGESAEMRDEGGVDVPDLGLDADAAEGLGDPSAGSDRYVAFVGEAACEDQDVHGSSLG
jgi:hypothetical protein